MNFFLGCHCEELKQNPSSIDNFIVDQNKVDFPFISNESLTGSVKPVSFENWEEKNKYESNSTAAGKIILKEPSDSYWKDESGTTDNEFDYNKSLEFGYEENYYSLGNSNVHSKLSPNFQDDLHFYDFRSPLNRESSHDLIRENVESCNSSLHGYQRSGSFKSQESQKVFLLIL